MLDGLMCDPTPRFVRQISHEPKEGYVWDSMLGTYAECDAVFRQRIIASMVQPDPKSGFLCRIRELGITVVREEQVAFGHFRLTVDDECVDVVRQAAYDCIPIVYKVDVVGTSESCPNHIRDAIEANR